MKPGCLLAALAAMSLCFVTPAFAKKSSTPAASPAATSSAPKPSKSGIISRPEDDKFEVGLIGPVWVYKPPAGMAVTSFVIFISGDDGWGKNEPMMADYLAKQGALVAAIDIIKWMRKDLYAKQVCLDISGELMALAQEAEKRYGLPANTRPILYGFSSGALMVYVALAQAENHTYSGAVSLGFCNDLWLNRPICRGAGLNSTFQAERNRTLFDPAPHIADRWAVINGMKDPYCKVPTQQAFAAQVPGSIVYGIPGISHGFGSGGDWLTPFKLEHRIMSGQQAAPDVTDTQPAPTPAQPAPSKEAPPAPPTATPNPK